jgi:acyl-CoA synthetase (AMP-forming)/AMP-acid ligase II
MSLLSRGGTIYLLGPEPADILQTIDLHHITGMATSPYGLGEFLKFFEADPAFDVTFDHIICQGAMLSRELSQRARARMCQNLYSSYGSTETTTVAFGPASVTERVPGAVGYVQPGVVVEIVDSAGKLLPPLSDGALRIRSDHMASEYVGDIGHVTPDGLLVITGREKTAINLGGDTVSPEVIESVIVAFPNIAEAGVFASNNDLGIAELFALIVPTGPFDEGALRRHCAERLPPYGVPLRFIVTDALPRGGQGKLERHRLSEFARAVAKSN